MFFKKSNNRFAPPYRRLLYICSVLILAGCGDKNPANVDVTLEEKAPEAKITSYTPMLSKLGLMTEIYDTGIVKIQSQDISDNTGASSHTGGEIQRNITEMVKSTLNSIGGNVVFIEYDPAYIQNQTVTGYSDFSNKLIPDVVLTGGITEFDRGLETRGDGTDFGASAEFDNVPSELPTGEIAVRYGDSSKYNLARITLDFNMKNFQTLAGISKMNTVTSIEVGKALGKREYGVALFGITFGQKGSIKKVQGRHEAVRLLVQASMIQMVGKYLVLPYWRLLGDDATSDPLVREALTRSYYNMDQSQRLTLAQEWLYLHGYDVQFTGRLDPPTEKALEAFSKEYQPGSKAIGANLFTRLYMSIPISYQTMERRRAITTWYASQQPQQTEPQQQQSQESAPANVSEAQPASQEPSKQQTTEASTTEKTAGSEQQEHQVKQKTEVASVAKPAQTETSKKEAADTVTADAAQKPASVSTTLKRNAVPSRAKIGRMLDEDEW